MQSSLKRPPPLTIPPLIPSTDVSKNEGIRLVHIKKQDKSSYDSLVKRYNKKK